MLIPVLLHSDILMNTETSSLFFVPVEIKKTCFVMYEWSVIKGYVLWSEHH